MASQTGGCSASSPVLPSISSVQPLRRSTSLTSRQRVSAADYWEATLRRRLGTPGPPPQRDEVPGLYDAPRLPMVGVSGAGKSAPSTVGPSASVVAWFAQYQCTKCGQVPTSLEARFCHLCGQSLPLPRVPGAVTGGSSRVAKNLAEVAAAAALEVMQSDKDWKGSRSKVSAKSLPLPEQKEKLVNELEKGKQAQAACNSEKTKDVKIADAKSSEPKEIEISENKMLVEHVRKVPRDSQGLGQLKDLEERSSARFSKAKFRHRDGDKRRMPGRTGKGKELPWGTRESQVAHWLDNIRPRRP